MIFQLFDTAKGCRKGVDSMEKFEKKENRKTETTKETATHRKTNNGDSMRKNWEKSNSAENRSAGNRSEEEAVEEGLADSGENRNDTGENKEAPADGDIETLKEDAANARQEAADSHDRFLRVCAEFENYKKRSQRQMDDYRKFSNKELIKDLLPVVDNLERAVAASRTDASDGCMVEGVEMTLNEILNIFKKYNVTPIEAQGKPFDPNYHEAVMQEESDEYPENTVVNELQKGYLLHDQLIRPSMVVVSKGASKGKNE